MSEILIADRVIERKKHIRHDALSDHRSNLSTFRAAKQQVVDDLSELENAISDVGDQAKIDALDGCALIVRIRALADGSITQYDRQINGEANNMTDINTAVQADGDYTAAEKLEYATVLAEEG